MILKILAFLSCAIIASITIFPNDITNVIGVLIGFLLYINVFYKGKLIVKLSMVFILYPVIVSINYITEDMGKILYFSLNESQQTMLNDALLHLITFVLRIPVWIGIYYFFKNKISQDVRKLAAKMWIFVDAVCITALTGIITSIWFAPEETYVIYPICIACLITCLGCIQLTSYISKTLNAEKDLSNLKLQQSYYEELEQNQIKISKFRHDMNNHMSVMSSFLKQGEAEEAKEYFSKFSDQMTVRNRSFCKNGIVNAVINNKYNLALEKQIDCFFNIDLDYLIGIDDISLCSIFANTLDNAIEAAVSIDDVSKRNITLKSRIAKGYFSYEISNSKQNEINEHNGRFISGKSNKKSHGFGIANVKDIVNSYAGMIDISYTEDKFSVVILIGQ